MLVLKLMLLLLLVDELVSQLLLLHAGRRRCSGKQHAVLPMAAREGVSCVFWNSNTKTAKTESDCQRASARNERQNRTEEFQRRSPDSSIELGREERAGELESGPESPQLESRRAKESHRGVGGM